MSTNTKARKQALAFSRKAAAVLAHQEMLERHAARKVAAEAGFTVVRDSDAGSVWHTVEVEDNCDRIAQELGIAL